jgi:hypothetical protein
MVLAADPRISGEWSQFAELGGQSHWNEVGRDLYSTFRLFDSLSLTASLGLRNCIHAPKPAGREQHQKPYGMYRGAATSKTYI